MGVLKKAIANKIFNPYSAGIFVGIIGPMLVFYIFYIINFDHIPIKNYLRHLYQVQIEAPLLSLCVLSNLLSFFLFIWTDKIYGAKGVLLSTFIYGAIIIYIKFLS